MKQLKDYSLLTPKEFYRVTRRDLCFTATSCSTGGDPVVADLQTVSDAGNLTSNALAVTGRNGQPTTGSFMYFAYDTGDDQGLLAAYNADLGEFKPLTIEGSSISINAYNGDTFISSSNDTRISTSSLDFVVGGGFATFKDLDDNGVRVKGADAIDPEDFVTLAQLQSSSPFDSTQKQTVTSTNETPTTIITFSTVTNTAYTLQVRIVGRASNNIDVVTMNTSALVINTDDTLSVTGTADLFTAVSTIPLGSTDINFIPSGTNILIQVTGVAATTINWKALLTILSV